MQRFFNSFNMQKNRFKKANTKYYLGLDLGIASVGWAVMSEENTNDLFEKHHHSLHDFGVHLFETPADAKSGTSHAEHRRIFRSRRRLIQRRQTRIKTLEKILKKCDFDKTLIKETEKLKQTNKILFQNNHFETELGYENIYLLRVKSLKEKITPFELYKILLNFANKRGYLDKFSDEKEEKDKKKTDAKNFDGIMAKTEKLTNNQTVAEAILKEKDFRIVEKKNSFILYVKNGKFYKNDSDAPVNKNKNYRFLFSRDAYEKELSQILNIQCEQQSSENFWQKIKKNQSLILDVIFKQRDFEWGPKCRVCQKKTGKCPNFSVCSRYSTFLDMIGSCPYFPEEDRGTKASLLFGVWMFAVEISKVLAHFKKNFELDYSQEFYKELLTKYLQNKTDKNKIKKIISEHPISQEHKDEIKKYFQSTAWKDGVNLNEGHYLKEIQKITELSQIIHSLSSQKDLVKHLSNKKNIVNQLGEVVSTTITPKPRLEKIKRALELQKINLKEQDLLDLKKIKSETHKPAKVSFKLMKKQIEIFLSGDPKLSADAVWGKFAFERTEENSNKISKIFQQLRDKDMEKNPVVFRAVNEARKVLKALYYHYGDFASINIEVARDVGKKFEERKKITNQQKSNETEKNNIIKILEAEISEELARYNREKAILKYKLWKQQMGQSIYSGKKIELASLLTAEVEIDHIVPQSVWGDDSINNKVLAFKEENQEKGNQLPKQYVTNIKEFTNRINDYRNKVKNNTHPFYIFSYQKLNYLNLNNLEGEELQDFISKNLNDTRYISKWFSSYVKYQLRLFKKDKNTHVNLIPGRITSFLRKNWLFKTFWGKEQKIRDITPFHHAIDAMILMQLKRKWWIELAVDLYSLKRAYQKTEKQKVKTTQYEIAKSKYDNLRISLKEKWLKKATSDSKYYRILNKFIGDNCQQETLFIKDLKEQIDKRIPVQLKLGPKTEKEEENKDANKENKDKKEQIIKLKNILSREEWEENVKNWSHVGNINLRYPIVSHKQNYRLRRPISDLENLGFKDKRKNIIYRLWKKQASSQSMFQAMAEIKIRKELEDIKDPKKKEKTWDNFHKQHSHSNNELKTQIEEKNYFFSYLTIKPLIDEIVEKEQNKFEKKIKDWKDEFENKKGFIENKSNSVISTDIYYGFLINQTNNKEKWLRNYEVQSWFNKKSENFRKEKELVSMFEKKQDLIVKGVNIEFNDSKLKKRIIKTFQSKMGTKICMQPNSLAFITDLKKNKEIFEKPNYYDSVKNILKDKKYKIIKNDILGNEYN